jgi:hypothetical protein
VLLVIFLAFFIDPVVLWLLGPKPRTPLEVLEATKREEEEVWTKNWPRQSRSNTY